MLRLRSRQPAINSFPSAGKREVWMRSKCPGWTFHELEKRIKEKYSMLVVWGEMASDYLVVGIPSCTFGKSDNTSLGPATFRSYDEKYITRQVPSWWWHYVLWSKNWCESTDQPPAGTTPALRKCKAPLQLSQKGKASELTVSRIILGKYFYILNFEKLTHSLATEPGKLADVPTY